MNIEQQEIEIKGILVHFFRSGTNGDYLESLNNAISEIQKVKNLALSDVVSSDYISISKQEYEILKRDSDSLSKISFSM
ncbi:hypothetical protein [Polaribacter sp. IC073]|uniref:hypothetical protein n=1 Tax=Polaribacter sp. IC073 TaxID=2508540 RepID=UPI0011BEEB2A|nr:hypothetical protein [Polaribacter sp. IC073]TXD45895.1 hypothetical protein ES045_15840 [Polaribacter sp. IC073]